MNHTDIFAIIAIVIGTIALWPYYIGIYRHTVKPHAFTWLTWSLVNGIVTAVQFSEKGGVGAWTSAIGTLQIAAVAVLAVSGYGTRNITRGDTLCFALALLAIPLWYYTKNPLWSVVLVCFIDGMAFYPTFRKSWLLPYQEKIFTYAIGNLRFIFTILALESITWASILFPIWVIALDTVFIAMLLWRRRLLPASQGQT